MIFQFERDDVRSITKAISRLCDEAHKADFMPTQQNILTIISGLAKSGWKVAQQIHETNLREKEKEEREVEEESECVVSAP